MVLPYRITEEESATTIQVSLSPSLSTGSVNVPINITEGADAPTYSTNPAAISGVITLTFTAGTATARSQRFTISADNDADSDNEVLTLSLGSLPNGVVESSTSGEHISATITFEDEDDRTVAFGSNTYTATEGGANAQVAVTLTPGATVVSGTITIPIQVTVSGAVSGDYNISGLSGTNALTFNSGESTKTFTITAASDMVTESGETLSLSFGPNSNIPDGVTRGTPNTATITLQDAPTTPTVSFEGADRNLYEGSTIAITVIFNPAPTTVEALIVPV